MHSYTYLLTHLLRENITAKLKIRFNAKIIKIEYNNVFCCISVFGEKVGVYATKMLTRTNDSGGALFLIAENTLHSTVVFILLYCILFIIRNGVSRQLAKDGDQAVVFIHMLSLIHI